MAHKFKVGDCVRVVKPWDYERGVYSDQPQEGEVGWVASVLPFEGSLPYLVTFLSGAHNGRPIGDDQIVPGWWYDAAQLEKVDADA